METMKSIIDSWQFNLAMFLIFAVTFTQFYKLAVKDSLKDGTATILFQIIAGISILIFVPFFDFKLPTDYRIYFLLLAASVFYTLNDRIQTTVRKNLEVSIYSILGQLSKVFLIIYGVLIFKESTKLSELTGAALIMFGNALLFYRKGKFELNKYAFFSALASFFMATALFIDVDISKHFNLPFYIMLTLIIPALILFSLQGFSIRKLEIVKEFNSKRKRYFLITGVSWGIMTLFTIRALQSAEVVFMAPLLATSVFLNVIVASFFHKETKNLIKKIIAALLVIIGVVLTVR